LRMEGDFVFALCHAERAPKLMGTQVESKQIKRSVNELILVNR
jgi:hypothetical protein